MNILKSGIAVLALFVSVSLFGQIEYRIDNADEIRVEKMSENLDLTDTQKADISEMLKANAQKQRDLKKEVRLQIKQAREERRVQLKKILTDEQYVKFLEDRNERNQKYRSIKQKRIRENRHMRKERGARRMERESRKREVVKPVEGE